MLDIGPQGRVSLGAYSLVSAAWIICDAAIEVGDYALIAWNVVLMDTYRVPVDVAGRRRELEHVAVRQHRCLDAAMEGRPIRIGCNAWVGFEACVLPGVTIGDGAIVGARAVVTVDVPSFTAVAGNPARIVRTLNPVE
jgi:acetyltransferase-like isoleucine patch superfamily enzyme